MNYFDNFKLQGLEEYKEFRYFKGENESPYPLQSIETIWWNFEKRYDEGPKKEGKWKDFNEYFDSWV